MAGIYIHIPFCSSKCSYCSFYSIANVSCLEEYLQTLRKEIAFRNKYLPTDIPVETLYLGGGTPSLLTQRQIETIINTLTRYYTFSEDFEFTLEANPEQLSPNYLKQLLSLGLNRLSIGVQSFDTNILAALRRRHTGEEARKAVLSAADTGFENLSIDLIYGLWGRNAEGWRKELQDALALPIVHLSAYALTIEENSILYKQQRQCKCAESEEEHAIQDFEILLERTRESGFIQYEISNFGKEGFFSRHNFAYWQRKPYLGLGPSAHSFNEISREWNVSNLTQYMHGINSGNMEITKEELTEDMKFNEYVMLNIRTYLGINLDSVEKYFGKERVEYLIEKFASIKKSYYTRSHNSFFLTDYGKLFADYITQKLFL